MATTMHENKSHIRGLAGPWLQVQHQSRASRGVQIGGLVHPASPGTTSFLHTHAVSAWRTQSGCAGDSVHIELRIHADGRPSRPADHLAGQRSPGWAPWACISSGAIPVSPESPYPPCPLIPSSDYPTVSLFPIHPCPFPLPVVPIPSFPHPHSLLPIPPVPLVKVAPESHWRMLAPDRHGCTERKFPWTSCKGPADLPRNPTLESFH